MKHITKLLLLFLLSLQAGITYAQPQIPASLQGYWQFKSGSLNGWDGMHIGNNFVEFYYDVMKLDSIQQSKNEYTLYLTHKRHGRCTIKVSAMTNDSAVFNMSEAKFERKCKHYDRNPEIEYLAKSEYSAVITGKWMANNNPKEQLSFQKGKLMYEGKPWEIIWLGDFMRREHRALIMNKGNYRLIYLAKQKDNSLKLTSDQNTTIYTPLPADVDKYAVFGNWFEPVNNEWAYGFFEKFVICGGKFWEYKSFALKNNKGTATLQNGNETLHLTFKKTNDSTLQLASGNQQAITYKKAGRTLPHYKTADTTHFADNHFGGMDTAYITGYLPNRGVSKPFEVSYHDMITDEQISYYGDVDSLGRFQLKVPVYNTTMVFLDWGQMTQFDVLEPNEHYFLFYDSNTKQTLFGGKNARIHNELAAFNIRNIPHSPRPKNINPLDFLALQRAGYKKANEYTNAIVKQMPSPSARLQDFIANCNKYTTASNLMQYRFELNRQDKEKLPDEYLAYVRDTLLPNPPRPITLNRDYFTFMRDYVGYIKDQKGYPTLNSNEVIIAMAKNGKLKLSKPDNDLVQSVCSSFIELWNIKDSVEQKKLYSKIPQKDIERYTEISRQNAEQINSEMSRMFAGMGLNSEMEIVNSVVSDKNVCDYYVAGLLYKNLNDQRKPMDDELFVTMINQVKTPLFKEKVISAQKHYTELSGKSVVFAESLKNTSHLKESKDADALWKELIAPYKGKIIYADFWGTWCGPCKRQMEYVADIKKLFAGKDVVFMYFANSSPEESWKNVIKTYSLTGENVVQYRLPDEQQGMLERRFGVKSFPTYMLIDRGGNVVDVNPPRPSEKETTVEYLNSWLERK